MCDNVITLDSVYKEKGKYQLVLKFAEYGCLRNFIIEAGTLPESKMRSIMEQLLLAVDLMHRKKILHRDIKPENILILNKDEL